MSPDSLSSPAGPGKLDRRAWLRVAASGLAAVAAGPADASAAQKEAPKDRGKPTRFEIACMTLPYARFPLERALAGIRGAGYRYVAWGTTHQEGSERVPVIAPDAPPGRAKGMAARCRDLG